MDLNELNEMQKAVLCMEVAKFMIAAKQSNARPEDVASGLDAIYEYYSKTIELFDVAVRESMS